MTGQLNVRLISKYVHLYAGKCFKHLIERHEFNSCIGLDVKVTSLKIAIRPMKKNLFFKHVIF